MAFAALSSGSAARMKRLFGIHITPPDLAVVPPTNFVFSRITTDFPALRITSAELIEPAPLPTTTQSKVSSKPAIFRPPLLCPPARSARFGRTYGHSAWQGEAQQLHDSFRECQAGSQ